METENILREKSNFGNQMVSLKNFSKLSMRKTKKRER